MENRKKLQREHYNKNTERVKLNFLPFISQRKSGYSWVNPALRSPYEFCEKILLSNCGGKRLLDYGCGDGVFSIPPAKNNCYVVGVDISDGQINLAKKRASYERCEKSTSFLVDDCEALKFSNEYFDIIFSAGTLSCLDLNNALSEMRRVLKNDGYVLIVDTLSHNPFLKLNRRIKMGRGLKTRWSVEHVLRMEDLKLMGEYFNKIEIRFFDLITPFAAPFCKKENGLVKLFKKIDKIMLKLRFLQKYAFKVVVLLAQPKHSF